MRDPLGELELRACALLGGVENLSKDQEPTITLRAFGTPDPPWRRTHTPG